MGNVDKVDRTLALNEMMFHVRRDAALRRRFVDDLDGLGREFGLSAAELEALRDRDVPAAERPRRAPVLHPADPAPDSSGRPPPPTRIPPSRPTSAPTRRTSPGRWPRSGTRESMATIVAAMAMTHAPGLTGWFTARPRATARRSERGTGELRRRLEAARPDVIVMLSNDHLLNWPINNVPRWTVGIGDEHVGPADWFDEWLALTKFHVKGHPELARTIVREADRLGVSFAYLRRLEFDDGFSVPLHYLTPRMDVPLVPVAMNCTVPPVPSTADTYRMGEALREIITRRWPGPERVAVVGTGGLSHEPGGPRYFEVDEKFDRWFLDLLAFGDHARIVEECTVARMEEAGSGGTAELLAWIAVLPFTAGPAEVIAYAPSVAWRTGTGFVAWPVAANAPAADTRDA